MRCLWRFAAVSALLFLAPLFPGGICSAVSFPHSSGHGGLVEVPVRVYRENRFVSSLGPGDFDLLVDGVPQKIESFALIRKNEHQGPRIFLLCFELSDVPPGIERAVDYFFENVPADGDRVLVQTHHDHWTFTIGPGGRAERRKTAGELLPRLLASLRKGRPAVERQLEALRLLAASGGDTFMTRWRAREVIGRLINGQSINETRYISIADSFQAAPERKQALVFFQEEDLSIPPLFKEDWQQAAASRREAFGRGRIQAFFADAGLTFHFVYLRRGKKGPTVIIPRDEGSALEGFFFQPYRDLAVETGGVTAAAADSVSAMKQAAAAAENGYLLAFRPASAPDAAYKEITVSVKKKGFTVFHRAGYIEK